ncbi:MAG: hypothetical protein QGH42_02415 [Kiritimatiellia bacterium]|jgi:hypothetical protein|nr:hypothetical protein [Kiritimatiellia bacterium]MDP6629780.1 hypothetical protein [Kiritimatiellia bacterium]MDP6811056.1 hypothetical protein [Kiritimatiellia bacterium]MDP7023089.1 hypothetical protein [Kiritimatiellia bacterium]
MTISELTHEQLVGLVGLLEAVVMADKTVSEAEQVVLAGIVEAIGEDMYRAVLEEADSRFADLDALKTSLVGIDSQDARELIYGTAWQEAVATPSVNHDESALLSWLASTWAIQA